ncbi:hypothetical protein MINTM018_04300 [Mycobacterium intracellulare]|uniref:Uncharacterized protein n=1 Tax=Mycobacterium intracellulare TaxID=1767 RepID=A0A7R7MPH2_MYCIT|nr:hypothetical protein MINTM018_04300 [Mycobacterium intracellulare]
MRDLETIDSELRLLAAVRRTAREGGYPMPTIRVIDGLLDERAVYVSGTREQMR